MAIDYSSGGSRELLPGKEVNWPPPSYMSLASPRGPQGRASLRCALNLKRPFFINQFLDFCHVSVYLKKDSKGKIWRDR